MRGFGRLSLSVMVFAGATLPGVARADDQPSATGKGIVGGALLGGEAVMLVEAAATVKPAWAYAVGGCLGAVGGGVGGYFAEQTDSPKLSLYMLAGGMALALPTTVAVLSASAYEPTNYQEDRPPADEPIADPARPSEAPPIEKPTSRAPVHHDAPVARAPKAPPALVGLGGGTLTVSVPAVEVRHVYTRAEVATYGVKQATEVDVPVLNVLF